MHFDSCFEGEINIILFLISTFNPQLPVSNRQEKNPKTGRTTILFYSLLYPKNIQCENVSFTWNANLFSGEQILY